MLNITHEYARKLDTAYDSYDNVRFKILIYRELQKLEDDFLARYSLTQCPECGCQLSNYYKGEGI